MIKKNEEYKPYVVSPKEEKPAGTSPKIYLISYDDVEKFDGGVGEPVIKVKRKWFSRKKVFSYDMETYIPTDEKISEDILNYCKADVQLTNELFRKMKDEDDAAKPVTLSSIIAVLSVLAMGLLAAGGLVMALYNSIFHP